MTPNQPLQRPAAWEGLLVLAAITVHLVLATTNLSAPSLWHDELVHVYVAKHIAATGEARLPSGAFYPSSIVYNYLLGGVVALFGDAETAVRAPAAVFGALGVLLLWFLTRRLAGREVALVALWMLALSPWHVAWAREARFYTLQSAAYLLLLLSAWRALHADAPRSALRWTLAALAAYTLGVLCAYHSLLALAPIGVLALSLLVDTATRKRALAALALCFAAGSLTLLVLLFNPNQADQAAVFETGIGGRLVDPARQVRLYYLHWLRDNHSIGFLVLGALGTAWALLRLGRRGLFAAAAFWAPILILTFLIGYRRERFMFFAFPIYLLLCAVGLLLVLRALFLVRRNWRWAPVSFVALLFLSRLVLSIIGLTGDSIAAAQGADTTLARRHPQWRVPGEYIRAHRTDEALLTTTYLPALYYAGPVDNWFPNRYTRWEVQESGLVGLANLDELKAFVAAHPRGYFLAESRRFEYWWKHGDVVSDLGKEFAWVEENMTRIKEGSSPDVTLYAWGEGHE